MTKKETSKLLSILAVAYDKFQVDSQGVKLKVWHELLRDIPYQVAQLAAKKLILKSPFPPVIADIRREVASIATSQDKVTATDAWEEVVNAIRYYGYYREKEALGSMNSLVARTVRAMGWREICLESKIGVIRGQFIKMYGQLLKRKQEEDLLPIELRESIRLISEGELKLKESVS
ncbi:loader and inhibitor of G40P protein [Orenia metallireducens]|uniref:Loader and inhibitor of phage G40P n=1 Tax=Orenia metallireducens TaxID=1413210 RepID=A0A285IK48_9FIRM|nr:replicative helicase loader/inhibitor [Orenia metallireducens]PRX15952.1 loader and inhibitor of G40P protein [Orenia metallireducens]SNY48338.1 Loader and inhibitor of phage G40P [Orenia metallireducens]